MSLEKYVDKRNIQNADLIVAYRFKNSNAISQ